MRLERDALVRDKVWRCEEEVTMKANILFVGLAYAALGGVANAQRAEHTMITPADLAWTKVGAVQITIIEGSITEAVPFTDDHLG